MVRVVIVTAMVAFSILFLLNLSELIVTNMNVLERIRPETYFSR